MDLTRPPPGWTAIRNHRRFLRSGLFIYAGGSIYRHWHEPLPGHIRESKQTDADDLAKAEGWRLKAKRLIRKLLELAQFRAFWVGNEGHFNFPIAISGSLGDCIFIDPVGRKVARHAPPDLLTPEQIDLRRRWATHIPSPAFEARQDEKLLIEQYIEGRLLCALNLETQKTVYRKILAYYSDLARSESKKLSSPIFDILFDKKSLALLDPYYLATFNKTSSLIDGTDWPVTPTYSDSHQGNLVVSQDNEPIFIDCMPIIFKIFFYTPLYIICRSKRLFELRRCYFSGEFDVDIDTLFKAGGSEFHATADFRELLVAVTLVLRAVRETQVDESSFDHAAFARRANFFLRRSGFRLSSIPYKH